MPARIEARNDAIASSATMFAATVGVPAATAQRQWRMRRAIVHAGAPFEPVAVVPRACQLCSRGADHTRRAAARRTWKVHPGSKEVDARVISVRRAASAADALERALEHVHEDWVLLCRPDVYFAPSFGSRLAALLDAIPANNDRTR